MPNPRLASDLGKDESDQGSDPVRQGEARSDPFRRALGLCAPKSVAVLSLAGGNGVKRAIRKRIVGIDIHAHCLAAVRGRYGAMDGLELYCADLVAERLSQMPLDLVHGALIFEHSGLGCRLENALLLVATGRCSSKCFAVAE